MLYEKDNIRNKQLTGSRNSMTEERLRDIFFAIGIREDDEAPDYDNCPMLFLLDNEEIELFHKDDCGYFVIDENDNRQMWFTQFNGIYFTFNDNKKIIKFGSGELHLLDGRTINLDEISKKNFTEATYGRKFKVSVKKEFQYYIYNRKEYQKESTEFKEIVDYINADLYKAWNDKIVRKGKCYVLTELDNN